MSFNALDGLLNPYTGQTRSLCGMGRLGMELADANSCLSSIRGPYLADPILARHRMAPKLLYKKACRGLGREVLRDKYVCPK